jgi:hypothetical protein
MQNITRSYSRVMTIATTILIAVELILERQQQNSFNCGDLMPQCYYVIAIQLGISVCLRRGNKPKKMQLAFQ